MEPPSEGPHPRIQRLTFCNFMCVCYVTFHSSFDLLKKLWTCCCKTNPNIFPVSSNSVELKTLSQWRIEKWLFIVNENSIVSMNILCYLWECIQIIRNNIICIHCIYIYVCLYTQSVLSGTTKHCFLWEVSVTMVPFISSKWQNSKCHCSWILASLSYFVIWFLGDFINKEKSVERPKV